MKDSRFRIRKSRSSKIRMHGKIIATLIILIFLLRDFLDGFLIIYEGFTVSDKKSIAAGVTLLCVTFVTAFTSSFYMEAICTSTSELFSNCAILLFLNDIDEKIYSAVKRACPSWVSMLKKEIKSESTKIEMMLDCNM